MKTPIWIITLLNSTREHDGDDKIKIIIIVVGLIAILGVLVYMNIVVNSLIKG